ncbi:MAG: hypothetical protein LLF98_10785 [Clostridium sp.]|uniref:hypothetical protein n=1 Tax=Clostridium sp. TaxID=1506 RepID=UPI0025C41592|nr:hypothetical protein [Clostridium sp.]MCE5221719.1 hypothetical protein [Clostridium sp.]
MHVLKLNEIFQTVYETRNKIIDTKKEEIDTFEDKDIITDNYNRAKILSDSDNKRNGTTLTILDLKLFY